MTDTRCTTCGLIADYLDADGRCSFCAELLKTSPRNGHRNGRNQAVETPTTCGMDDSSSELQKRARNAILTYGGIRPAALALGEKLGETINHGVIALAARGEDFPKARHVLGLPPEPVPVYPCPECGKVHKQLKTCKPGRKASKRRMAFWLTDDEFEQVRAAADKHPNGRAVWLMEKARE